MADANNVLLLFAKGGLHQHNYLEVVKCCKNVLKYDLKVPLMRWR